MLFRSRDAEKYATEDTQFRSENDTRNQLEQLIYQADALHADKKKLTKEQRAALSQPIKDAKKALKSKDVNEIKSAVTYLEQTLSAYKE